jgi:hypothetical protein
MFTLDDGIGDVEHDLDLIDSQLSSRLSIFSTSPSLSIHKSPSSISSSNRFNYHNRKEQNSRRTSSLTSVGSLLNDNNHISNLEIVKNINSLFLLENEHSDDSMDINQYRLQVKLLLVNVLTKLEDNLACQRDMERELSRLNDVVRVVFWLILV